VSRGGGAEEDGAIERIDHAGFLEHN